MLVKINSESQSFQGLELRQMSHIVFLVVFFYNLNEVIIYFIFLGNKLQHSFALRLQKCFVD